MSSSGAAEAERELAADLAAALAGAVEFVLADPRIETAGSRAEALRYVCRIVSGGHVHQVENHDPAYPHLTPIWTALAPYGCPNPDFTYLTAPVHGDHTYRVFGSRGSARFLGLGVFAGDHHELTGMHILDTRIHVDDGRGDFEVGADGAVEFTLSREDPGGGNWLRLPAEHGVLIVRYAYYDWEREEPPLISIERTAAVYPPPAPRPEEILDRVRLLRDFVRDIPGQFAAVIAQYYEADPRTIPFPPLGPRDSHDDQLGFGYQQYGQSHYRLAPGEAAILEVTPPESWYWGFHLATQMRESSELNMRSTSINGHQAVLDEDGAFRAVIAGRDPGVPNWLDTGGRPEGLLVGRYIGADSVPVPSVEVVPFERIRQRLPAATPAIGPAERSEAIRRRMHAIHRRHDV